MGLLAVHTNDFQQKQFRGAAEAKDIRLKEDDVDSSEDLHRRTIVILVADHRKPPAAEKHVMRTT